jgi:GTP-binding protein Era
VSDPMSRAATGQDGADVVETRCGFVAVIGAPNAGKSTLVNRLVGSKVSIVSRKAQTTRARVRGIVMSGPTQLVLIDTPGIFEPRRRLDRAMVDAAWGGAGEGDVVLLVVDAAHGLTGDTERIVARLSAGPPARLVVALNKVDRVRKEALLALAGALATRLSPEATFMISALDGSGVEDLTEYLSARMPAGPWHFPADEVSDMPMRLAAAEITREHIYDRLHDELPYHTMVETTAWKDLKDGSARIEQTILVTREGHRQIVLGKRGETIKTISMEARKQMAALFERPVHLFLFVKVEEGWADNLSRLRDIGLEPPKGDGA